MEPNPRFQAKNAGGWNYSSTRTQLGDARSSHDRAQNWRAIGYVRCSTQEQRHSGLGLDVQRERIDAYCRMQALDLIDIVTDAGVSGGKPLATREGGRRILDAVSRRQAGAVVILKLDRMFRNAADCLATTDKWDKAGIALHIVDLGGNAIDTTSAAGRFMLVVLAGAAEMERNLVKERTRSALAVRRANGQRTGTIPYGYELSTDGATLAPNPTEQAIIAQIHKMRAAGMPLEHIAEELTDRRIPTKTGRSPRWTHQTVARILRRDG